MENQVDQEKKILYLCKALALFSIVSAHVAGVGGDASKVQVFCAKILGAWGTVGVPVFFAISGYLYERSLSRRTYMELLRGKLRSLALPWLVCGTGVWLYVALRKGGLTFGNWFSFLIGEGSYLYYMTVLLLLYLLYIFLRKKNVLVYLGILVWVVSNIVISNVGWKLSFSPYLNVLTWQGWFLLGALIQRKQIQTSMGKVLKKIWLPCLAAGMAIIIWNCACGITITYWHRAYLLMELLLLPSIYYFAVLLVGKSLLMDIGEKSFSIYLLHMPIAGILANIMNRFPNGIFILARPVIAVLLTYAAIYAGGKVCDVLRVGKVYAAAIGKRGA